LKQNVYHPQQAGFFSNEAIQAIYEMECKEPEDFLRKACACIFITTGMRGSDLRHIRSCNVKIEPGTKQYSRNISMIMDRMKADPLGELPESQRKLRIPCRCLNISDEPTKRSFNRRMKMDYKTICCTPCPFQAFLSYIELCPDPFGAVREDKRKSNMMLKSLYLMRALTTRGLRTLTELPLGKQI